MKDLIESIAKALVDYPEQVSIREFGENHTKIFELEVARVDIGKVIGRRGRTARAMRLILGGASAKENKRAVLEIVDHK